MRIEELLDMGYDWKLLTRLEEFRDDVVDFEEDIINERVLVWGNFNNKMYSLKVDEDLIIRDIEQII